MKISTKLLLSFLLCALVTLAVGLLGIKGVVRLSTALELTFSNNLVSVSNTAATLNGLVAHNRGLYRLMDASKGDVSPQDRDRVRQDIAQELKRSQASYATYRATPLEDDERAAGDKLVRVSQLARLRSTSSRVIWPSAMQLSMRSPSSRSGGSG